MLELKPTLWNRRPNRLNTSCRTVGGFTDLAMHLVPDCRHGLSLVRETERPSSALTRVDGVGQSWLGRPPQGRGPWREKSDGGAGCSPFLGFLGWFGEPFHPFCEVGPPVHLDGFSLIGPPVAIRVLRCKVDLGEELEFLVVFVDPRRGSAQ